MKECVVFELRKKLLTVWGYRRLTPLKVFYELLSMISSSDISLQALWGIKTWQEIVIPLRYTLFFTSRACFKQLLRAVPAHSALFEIWNVFFSTKNFKNTFCLRGCSALNALNLEKWGVKIYKCVLLLDFLALFWLYRTHALIF